MIPRGGESLVRAVCEAATMPVLKHYMGVCHLYIDEGADLGMALRLAHNGKVQRPGVCNALECLLVHEKEAAAFLPMLAGKLGADGVEFRADARSLPLLSGAKAVPARPGDFGQELFHDLILAVRVVDSLDDALDHIASYGSNHTEVICTNNHANATRFLREADASLTAVNASTRFNDGGQLGLGAEIGICTSKLHSNALMGVNSRRPNLWPSGRVRSGNKHDSGSNHRHPRRDIQSRAYRASPAGYGCGRSLAAQACGSHALRRPAAQGRFRSAFVRDACLALAGRSGNAPERRPFRCPAPGQHP